MAVDPTEGSRARRGTSSDVEVTAWWRVGSRDRAELLGALLCVLAIVGPLRSSYEMSRTIYGPFAATASFFVSDVPLALLIAVALPGAVVSRRHALLRHPGALALAALVAWLVVALVVHPSAPGVLHVVRLIGAVAIAVAVVEVASTAHAATAVRCLLLSTAFQAVLALAQTANNGPLGLSALGEKQELTFFGSQAAGQGTFNHPYILVGWTLVVIGIVVAFRRRQHGATPIDDVATVLLGVVVGITFSRAAAIGVVVAAPLLFVATRHAGAARRAVLLVAAGAVVAGVAFNGGWVNRARSTGAAASSGSLEAASTDRGVLLGDAVRVLGDHPIAGVGPSRYLAGLQDVPNVAPDDFKPVHDVPLLVAAEGGIPALVLVVVLLVALLYGAVRAGPMALAVGALFAPYVALDHFPYYSVQGIIATGLWIGALDTLAARGR